MIPGVFVLALVLVLMLVLGFWNSHLLIGGKK